MKKYFGILAAGALAACGSSSNNNNGTTPPPLGNFTYSTPAPATQAQASQANNAQQQVPDVVTGATTGSATQAADAPFLATSITSSVLDSRALPPNPAYSTVGKLVKATRSGGLDDPSCLVETATTITYNKCAISSGGTTETINGTLSVGPGTCTWNLTFTGSETDSSSSFSFQGVYAGNITVTGDADNGTINGQATATFTENISASGVQESYAYTAGVDFLNLVYTLDCQQADPAGFFVSGTLEARRNVAESGTFTAPVDNAAVEFTWTQCNTVKIAIGSD